MYDELQWPSMAAPKSSKSSRYAKSRDRSLSSNNIESRADLNSSKLASDLLISEINKATELALLDCLIFSNSFAFMVIVFLKMV